MASANKYFELHITMEGEKEKVKHFVEGIGWKFSCIDGDPNLGDGVRCFATKQYNRGWSEELILATLYQAARLLAAEGITITRRKVELVIYDDRSSKVNAIGNCEGDCITDCEIHNG